MLSSPDVVLSRLTAHRSAALRAARAIGGSSTGASPADAPRWPPLLLLDPSAGEGNYTQHLPDAMGRMPALRLVEMLGWHAVLAEPNPDTYRWLSRHFRPHVAAGRVRLLSEGLTAQAAATNATLYSLRAHVPELEGRYESGLPTITRQRLQWGSSAATGATSRS